VTASDEKPARKKPEQKTAAQPGLKRNASRITFPRSFTGRNLPMIAFPLGGIGTGTISLGGRGQLRDREILNRPEKGNSPQYGFPAIWVRAGQAKPVARLLEARLHPLRRPGWAGGKKRARSAALRERHLYGCLSCGPNRFPG